MSSLASLNAVIDSMTITGTAVVDQGREETCGIVCRKRMHLKHLITSGDLNDATVITFSGNGLRSNVFFEYFSETSDSSSIS